MVIVRNGTEMKFSFSEKHFIAAISISLCGDVLIPTAFALEALRLDSTGSSFTIILMALWFGRFVGTVLFQHLPHLSLKRTMILSDFARLCAQLLLFMWVIVFVDSLLAMTVSSLVYGVATSFFIPSRFSFTPEVVKKERLQKFNSIINFLYDSFMVAGPAVATFIFLRWGFSSILLIDSLSFCIAIVLLMRVQRIPGVDLHHYGDGGENDATGKASSVGGIGLWQSVRLLPVWAVSGLITWSCVTIIIGYAGVAGPAFLIENFSPSQWALVATSLALGSLLGSLAQLHNVFRNLSWKTLMMAAAVLLSVQIVLFAISDVFIPILLVAFTASCIVTSAGISWDTLAQQALEGEKLRVFSNADSFLTTATIPIGMVLFGVGVKINHSVLLTIIIAALCIITLIPLALSDWSEVSSAPEGS